MDEKNKEEFIAKYYDNNAVVLHKMVDKILHKYSSACQYIGLSEKDRDDFYSLANEVFTDILKRYDGKQSFDGFLYSCLSNKIKSELTARNRIKRSGDKNAISMDILILDTDNRTIGDMISDKKLINPEDGLIEEMVVKSVLKHFKFLRFRKERLILTYMLDGYSNAEIADMLNMSKKSVAGVIQSIRNGISIIDILKEVSEYEV